MATRSIPLQDLPARALALHPFCNTCGWRKGGRDSWDGQRCKCGHAALPFSPEVNVIFDRLDAIDLALTLIGERAEPAPMGEEDALRAERAHLVAKLDVAMRRVGSLVLPKHQGWCST